jgi:hypothetical protein
MDGKKIVFIVIAVLTLAWFAGGDQKSSTSTSGSLFKLPTFTIAGSQSSGDKSSTIEKELQRANREADSISKEIGQLQIEKESSSLSREISFSSSNARSTDPNTEYLTLSLNNSHNGRVLITGFELRSTASGRGTTIPKGVELPFAGVINEETPIFIKPGDQVIVATSRSPVGYSFRENKCTGYFSQFQRFTPALRKSCPLASDEDEALLPNYFDDKCLDYLQTIPRCTAPFINFDTAFLQSQCKTFIEEKLNYKGCVEEHKSDPDFYKNIWHVYLGRNEELWKQQREVIKLYDLSKKTIGTITY